MTESNGFGEYKIANTNPHGIEMTLFHSQAHEKVRGDAMITITWASSNRMNFYVQHDGRGGLEMLNPVMESMDCLLKCYAEINRFKGDILRAIEMGYGR